MPAIQGADAECRYLPEFEGTGGSFSTLLKKLGCKLPSGVELIEAVRWGWIQPALRVEVPARFITSWKNFPSFPRRGHVDPEDWWADHAWTSAACPIFGWGDDATAPSPTWYTHPLDRDNDERAAEIRCHAIATGQGQREPAGVPHASRVVRPWIDYYAYWQAYELLEVMQAAVLFQPVQNTPMAEETIGHLPSLFTRLKTFSDRHIEAVENRWADRRRVFDWISRFRTFLGVAIHPENRYDLVPGAAKALAQGLGLSAETIRSDIRDTLLVLWSEWEWQEGVPQPMRRQLQQDIYRAVELHDLVADFAIDPLAPEWDPPDRNSRPRARLKEALPFEHDQARELFPGVAAVYLARFNALARAEQRFDEERIRLIAAKWWAASPALRRFVLSFHRLHEHYGGMVNDDNAVGLVSQTPADFLILSGLHAEKLLAERRSEADPQTAASATRALLRFVAHKVGRAFLGLDGPSAAAFLSKLDQTFQGGPDLRNLPLERGNPFLSLSESTEMELFLVTAFADFKILRDYVAHHSCLDFELIHGGWGADPIEAVLVVVLAALDACELPRKRSENGK